MKQSTPKCRKPHPFLTIKQIIEHHISVKTILTKLKELNCIKYRLKKCKKPLILDQNARTIAHQNDKKCNMFHQNAWTKAQGRVRKTPNLEKNAWTITQEKSV